MFSIKDLSNNYRKAILWAGYKININADIGKSSGVFGWDKHSQGIVIYGWRFIKEEGVWDKIVDVITKEEASNVEFMTMKEIKEKVHKYKTMQTHW